MEHLCFYKNSTDKTFTIISTKVVYLEAYCISSIASSGNEDSTAIKCSIPQPGS